MKNTLLIPALLDHHWPLLRWAFESEAWQAVVLEDRTSIEDLGLRNLHNDLCYPFILITGQVLSALHSGQYDPKHTAVLISQAGDSCRGSCLIRLLRPVLDREGFSDVSLLSFNLRGVEQNLALPISLTMARRALAAAFWGDTLMLLSHQTRPYETTPGETNTLVHSWTETLSADLQANRNLSLFGILHRCREVAESFRSIRRIPRTLQKVALVGDIYTKYCRLGNWDLEDYLERNGCEVAINGLTWHMLYYLSTHLDSGPLPARLLGKVLLSAGESLQKRMICILKAFGFNVLPPCRELKALAEQYSTTDCSVGSGWLLSAEIAAWVHTGYPKVLAALPFACLPGHIYGRGQYAALQRKFPGSMIVGVDYDASIRDGTVQTRVRMLLDEPLEPCISPDFDCQARQPMV